jgi:hypothetical protein
MTRISILPALIHALIIPPHFGMRKRKVIKFLWDRVNAQRPLLEFSKCCYKIDSNSLLIP